MNCLSIILSHTRGGGSGGGGEAGMMRLRLRFEVRVNQLSNLTKSFNHLFSSTFQL